MKKLFTYVQVLVLPFLLACNEDEGNYDYRAINDVTISGIEETYTVINKADKLEISPVITTSMGDDSKLTYEWKVQTNNSPDLNYHAVVGTDRDLSWEVDLPYTSQWDLLLRVTDTETGVVTLASTILNVTTRTRSGLLLIGENLEGNSQVDFISMAGDTLVMKNVMNENLGFDNSGKPVNICKSGKGSLLGNFLWVMTDKEGWRFDANSFAMMAGSEFSQNTYIVDDTYVPEGDFHVVDIFPHNTPSTGFMSMTNCIAVCSNGLLFAGTTGFVDPMNVLSDEKGIALAKPYLLTNIMYTGPNAFIFYDETHERFLKGTLGGSFMGNPVTSRLSDNAGDPFPWNNQEVGRTLQYAQNSSNTDGGSSYGNSYALMRDKNTGDYYIYKFYVMNLNKLDCYTPGKVAIDLDKATFHVFSSQRTALYYTVGSKLYGLDYNKGNEKVTLIKDFGDEITMMEVDDIKEFRSDYIYVATYNPTTGGTLIKLKQGTNPDKMELEEVPGGKWTGLSKVKGMTYK